jgi:hypothetical protein
VSATGNNIIAGLRVKFIISVAVIEVTDGDEHNIATLSKAVCNGQLSCTQTHIIPLTTQEDENKNGEATEQAHTQSFYFHTIDVAVTGLYKYHKHVACNQVSGIFKYLTLSKFNIILKGCIGER